MDRRAAFGQIATAGAVLGGVPAIASTDGATSSASIRRARGLYGSCIADLKGAIAAGDFAAIAEEKNAFILFNSGAYPTNKAAKAKAIKQTNAIFTAIRARDKSGVASAYNTYIADNKISPLPVVDSANRQGQCGDFDYKVRSSAGAIYVR